MVRAPCCEKMGLKKGPWTPEEDHILVTYIQQYGHGNWRALPKLAGLLRCGKSCRLRWTNYLRPDIKRGNFTRAEEDAIINLHQVLGNRWSAIAARLPGRTDNEIKNVWHTHLKKRLKTTQDSRPHCHPTNTEQEASLDCGPVSPPQCTSSDASSAATTTSSGGHNTSINNSSTMNACMKFDDSKEGNLQEADESFWSEVLSANTSEDMMSDFQAMGGDPQVNVDPSSDGFSLGMYDDNSMDFWFNIFPGAEEISELLEIPDLLEN